MTVTILSSATNIWGADTLQGSTRWAIRKCIEKASEFESRSDCLLANLEKK